MEEIIEKLKEWLEEDWRYEKIPIGRKEAIDIVEWYENQRNN